MKGLIPEPAKIEMEFDVQSTVGMSAKERVDYFDDNYSFRDRYAKSLANKEIATKADIEFSDGLSRIIEEQREYFKTEYRLFSLTVQNIALAFKNKS